MAGDVPRIGIRSVAVVATLLALIVLLATESRDSDLGLRSRMHGALQDYEFADAELTRDVLRARGGMSANYDALAADRRALQRALARLAQVAQSGSAGAREALRPHIERISDVLAAELDGVERLKSAIALQRNSVQFLVSTAASQADGPAVARAQAERLVSYVLGALQAPAGSDWERSFARAARDGDGRERPGVTGAVERPEESAGLPEAFAGLPETHRAHARMALFQRFQAQALLRRILAAPGRADAPALRATVLVLTHQAEVRSARYRNGLAFVAILLLAYVVFQVRELRRLDAQKRAQELELIEASRLSMAGLLSTSIAHEIGNYIQSVESGVRFLCRAFGDASSALEEERAAPGAEGRAGLPVIAGRPWAEARAEIELLSRALPEAARETWRMAEDVKRFASPGAANGHGDALRFDVNESVERIARLVQHRFHRGNTRLERTLDPALPPARGSAQRFEHVLINLVINGLDAIPGPGRAVQVRTGLQSGRILVTVRDEGIGIAPADLPRLGQAFFTTRRDSGGTGLGLMVAFANVARLGGSLRFESTPGAGTTASVELPVAGAADRPGAATTED